ncbi:hypothetical protein ACJRO7_033962 [Eucalyptus globulus]|uniref:CCHC-type domain-containing protein n=1 Tax=Eucalyptus globulus TaxID=34317 RepID=A0ABD3J582_EUCGL
MIPPVVDVGVATPNDPRVDGILRVLEAMGNRMDQQAATVEAAAQATATAAATGATPAAAPAVTPAVAPAAVNVENPPEIVVAARLVHKLVEHFLKLNPPLFTGSGDPEATSSWIQKLEKAFALLMCNEAEKVMLATYQLEGVADTRWMTTREMIFGEGAVQDWNTFREAFNDNFFSETAREVKMAEFQRLRQGSLSVDEYEAKFVELSRYAPELIENPVNRVRRFRDGCRQDLRSALVLLDLKTYNDIYRRAQKIEKDHNDKAASFGSRFSSHRDNIRQGKRPMFGNRFQSPPSKKNGFNRSGPIRNIECRLCGRRHGTAPCPARTGACFECGQQGHITRFCLKKQRGQPQLPPPPPIRQIGGYAPQNALQGG